MNMKRAVPIKPLVLIVPVPHAGRLGKEVIVLCASYVRLLKFLSAMHRIPYQSQYLLPQTKKRALHRRPLSPPATPPFQRK